MWLSGWLPSAETGASEIHYNRRVQRPEGAIAGAGIDEQAVTQALLAMAFVNMPEHVHFQP